MTGPAREIRPHLGEVVHTDGTVVAVRFLATDDPATFRAVDLDGNPVLLQHGDKIHVDQIGPGQAVTFETPD